MNKSYFVRKVDELGRIVIPVEVRKVLDIKEKDNLGISLQNNGIFIKKEEPYCVFCNSNINLESLLEKHICKNCIKKLK